MYEWPCLLTHVDNIQRPWHAANYCVQNVIDNLDGYDRLVVWYNDYRLLEMTNNKETEKYAYLNLTLLTSFPIIPFQLPLSFLTP